MADATIHANFEFPYNTAREPLPQQLTSPLFSHSWNGQSYVKLNDGTIGCVWAETARDPSGGNYRTGGVYWGTCPDYETLFEADGGVTYSKQLVQGDAFRYGQGYQVNVQRDNTDGYLYLSIFYLRVLDGTGGSGGSHISYGVGGFPNTPNKGTYMFRSTDEGATWSLWGTVQESTLSFPSGDLGGYGCLGEYFDLGSGVWVLPVPWQASGGGGTTRGRNGVMRSTDYGQTWTDTFSGIHATVVGATRRITYNPLDGNLYYGDHRGTNSPHLVWYSDGATGGATWTPFVSINLSSATPEFDNTQWNGVSVNGGMRWVSYNGNTFENWNLIGLQDPFDPSDPILDDSVSSTSGTRARVGLQELDDGWWVIMNTNRVLGIYEPLVSWGIKEMKF